ncbi:MAG: hypothetical protein SGI84_04220 [Gemmatimonadota bacterium]|mgnify:CR=1 FL=1|nr:hypothetical protein [Gemmatimonadota bacterium]
MSRAILLRIGLSVVLLAACGSDPPVGPVAGELTLNLVSPGATDGAILLRVTGEIESVTGLGGYVIEAAEVPGGMWRIVVAGTIVPGPIARIRVPDINDAAPYLAVVEQVAARGTFALLSTAGYSVRVTK